VEGGSGEWWVDYPATLQESTRIRRYVDEANGRTERSSEPLEVLDVPPPSSPLHPPSLQITLELALDKRALPFLGMNRIGCSVFLLRLADRRIGEVLYCPCAFHARRIRRKWRHRRARRDISCVTRCDRADKIASKEADYGRVEARINDHRERSATRALYRAPGDARCISAICESRVSRDNDRSFPRRCNIVP